MVEFLIEICESMTVLNLKEKKNLLYLYQQFFDKAHSKCIYYYGESFLSYLKYIQILT